MTLTTVGSAHGGVDGRPGSVHVRSTARMRPPPSIASEPAPWVFSTTMETLPSAAILRTRLGCSCANSRPPSVVPTRPSALSVPCHTSSHVAPAATTPGIAVTVTVRGSRSGGGPWPAAAIDPARQQVKVMPARFDLMLVPCLDSLARSASRRHSAQYQLLHAPVRCFSGVDLVLGRTRQSVRARELLQLPARSPDDAQNGSVERDLEDPAGIRGFADEHHLAGPGRDADRIGRADDGGEA